MAERWDFGREALLWLCKEGRACLKSYNPVMEVEVFSASLCYKQVEPESAAFHSHVLCSCLEGSDVIPSGGEMCRHVPHLRGSTMWRS